MKDAGPAWMSIGRGSGQNRAVEAAKDALSSPLLDVSVQGAKGVLFNVVGPNNLTLFEVNNAAEIVRQAIDPEANCIFGVGFDPNMENEVRLTLIATGFETQDVLGGSVRDKELNRVLKNIKSEELDIPSFLRQRRFTPAYQGRPQVRS